jgi:ketosteroid isomerase-like protein
LKRCPTCHRTYSEEHLTFCIEDGTPLVPVETPAEEAFSDEVTRVSSSRRDESSSGQTPPYQPPGSYSPPGYTPKPKGRTWPWVLGILAIVFMIVIGFGIAAVVFIPRALRAANDNRLVNINANRNDSNRNFNRNSNSNSNRDSANDNDNENSNADESAPAPTDSEAVLADLKTLEDEWTVANINADKKKLNRILADDYVGITDGRAQGKAEYLQTIRRDTTIQHWEFDNLKVTLNGDRASLTGILRLDVKDDKGQVQPAAFRFTDKFVWRDGRWQATASEVEAVKPGTSV